MQRNWPLGHATPRRCQTLVMAAERPRQVQVRPFPSNRRLATAAMRAGRRKMPMYGLVDVDVTTANRLLADHDPPWSLTAFVVASVARAAAAHPAVHAYRNWRGQLVTHQHVDVAAMVEIFTPQGLSPSPMSCVTLTSGGRPELTAELRRVKRDPSASRSGRRRRPWHYGAVLHVPRRNRRRDEPAPVRRRRPGHGPGHTGLTVTVDHNVVDEAPAARFAAEFRELLESAAVITPPS